MKKKAIIISGPTGTGKSDIAVQVALFLKSKQIPSSILNFDSLCFYNELSIGTAKPTLEMRDKIPHYLIDISSIRDEVNAHQFSILAEEKLKELIGNNHLPILVGGSPFYLRALLKGMYSDVDSKELKDQSSNTVKKNIEELLKVQGRSALISYLKIHDPEVFKKIHENDTYRVIRAVEYHQTNGKKISEQAKAFEESDPFDLGQNRFKEIEFLHLNLDIPKEKHLIGLQKRVNSMIQQGLIEEVINLLKSGFSGTEKPLSSIGYKETIDFLHGKIKSKNELAEKINISTRQLAKSQRTFLKKIFPKESFNPITDSDKLLNRIMEFLGLH